MFFINKKTCMYICICVSAENRFRTGNHPVPRAKRRQRHSPAWNSTELVESRFEEALKFTVLKVSNCLYRLKFGSLWGCLSVRVPDARIQQNLGRTPRPWLALIKIFAHAWSNQRRLGDWKYLPQGLSSLLCASTSSNHLQTWWDFFEECPLHSLFVC